MQLRPHGIRKACLWRQRRWGQWRHPLLPKLMWIRALASDVGLTLSKVLVLGFALPFVLLLSTTFSLMMSRFGTLSLPGALRRSALVPIPGIGGLSLSTIARMARRSSMSRSFLKCAVHAVLPVLPTSRTVKVVALHHTSAIRALPRRRLLRSHLCFDAADKCRISGMMMIQGVLDAQESRSIQNAMTLQMQMEPQPGFGTSPACSTALPRESRCKTKGTQSPSAESKRWQGREDVPDTYTRA